MSYKDIGLLNSHVAFTLVANVLNLTKGDV